MNSNFNIFIKNGKPYFKCHHHDFNELQAYLPCPASTTIKILNFFVKYKNYKNY